MKYLALILLLLFTACENSDKKKIAGPGHMVSPKDMEVYVDENSILNLGDTSQIWVKRVFPEGKSDELITIGRNGQERVINYTGISSLNYFDCKQKLHIVNVMYYFNGDTPVHEVDNIRPRIEDKTKWNKIEPGSYVENIYQLVCKPAAGE